jgi:hypothetical protein
MLTAAKVILLVLEFDPIKGKGAVVSKLVSEGASIERIKIELNLCVVRCANRHRKKTMNELKWFRGKKGSL